MKNFNILPYDYPFWYLDKQQTKRPTNNEKADLIIVGGGMTGLSAAQAALKKGLRVILLEKNFCGSGATGKSSGYITPDAELSLKNMTKLIGKEAAETLWQLPQAGVGHIRTTIEKYNIDCDYQQQDTLILAHSATMFHDYIVQEYEQRKHAGYQSALYTQEQLPTICASNGYYGGISYGGTFGIQAFRYCQQLKKILQEQGLIIYEETPVYEIHENQAITPHGTMTADCIMLATDHFTRALGMLTQQLYHVQTFLMISSPLSNEQINAIFPAKRYMAWDTEMIYNYFRITGDNRLLIGGADLLYTYAAEEKHNNKRMMNKLTTYIKKKFPHVDINVEYIWPGLIGISKDLLPLVGYDEHNKYLYHATAATGLPWGAALGTYAIEHIVDNKTTYATWLNPYRTFPIGSTLQTILGTPLSFALSNLWTSKSI